MKLKFTLVFFIGLPAMIYANNLPIELVQTPAGKNSLAPNLCSIGNHFALSWIERKRNGVSQFQFSSWNGFKFDKKSLVASSKKMFTNWADIPSMIELPNGDFYAQWLDRISSKTYAYGIRIEHSTNRGKSWNSLGWLHNDTSETEHGFASMIPDGNKLRAFWLDGRMMTKPSGKMMLRTATLHGNFIKDEKILDDNVCTCCPTSAIQHSTGAMVVYRDRSTKEIRDISFVLQRDGGWTQPATLNADNWLMPGCPVNGASIGNSRNIFAISRFTVINNKPQVILRVFAKGKIETGKEIILDNNTPIGRCVTICSKDSIYTIWIGLEEQQSVLRFAEVSFTGEIKRKKTLTKVDGNRSSGLPRAILSQGYLWVCWTDTNGILLGRLNVND